MGGAASTEESDKLGSSTKEKSCMIECCIRRDHEPGHDDSASNLMDSLFEPPELQRARSMAKANGVSWDANPTEDGKRSQQTCMPAAWQKQPEQQKPKVGLLLRADLSPGKNSTTSELSTTCSDVGVSFSDLSPKELGQDGSRGMFGPSFAASLNQSGRGRIRVRGCTYEGQLVNNVEHGDGVLTWDDGREYRGQFEVGRFHGVGVMTWPDGRRYVGEYFQDRKHGVGTFSWNDGRCYEGQWIDGKKHGFGSYTNARGKTCQGMWAEDHPLLWDSMVQPSAPDFPAQEQQQPLPGQAAELAAEGQR